MLMTILAGVVCVVAAVVPSGLRTELIEDTETVYSGGIPHHGVFGSGDR